MNQTCVNATRRPDLGKPLNTTAFECRVPKPRDNGTGPVEMFVVVLNAEFPLSTNAADVGGNVVADVAAAGSVSALFVSLVSIFVVAMNLLF